MIKKKINILKLALIGLGFSASIASSHAQSLERLNSLAKTKNCFSCHSVEKKVLGPGFKEVSQKYAGKAEANTLADKIKKGGVGKWGAVPMPANPQVSDAEAQELATLIMGLK